MIVHRRQRENNKCKLQRVSGRTGSGPRAPGLLGQQLLQQRRLSPRARARARRRRLITARRRPRRPRLRRARLRSTLHTSIRCSITRMRNIIYV